jgi:5-methylthioadenosine/S-adenosylhomocysteine deaminase
VRLGLSPHAPYSAGPAVFLAAAAEAGVPLSTHLAESEDERRVVCAGSGPMCEFFRSLGAWDDVAASHFVGHASPVQMAMPWLVRAPWVLAHVNDCSDDDMKALASTNCSVAYCPRSSDYFEHHTAFGPHRYREMLAAGINVALGTDSVLNLPVGPTSERLSTLDEIRFLFRRDGTDPALLVRMATTHGARALGLDASRFAVRPGPVAGLVAVPVDPATRGLAPAERVVRSDDAPILLWPAGPGVGVAHPHAGILAR